MTEALATTKRPLIRYGSIVRALVALLIIAPFLYWAFLTIPDAWRPDRVGRHRSSPFIFFVIFFPPGWWAFLIVHFSDQENLAWNQYVTSVVFGILFIWFLLINWHIGMFGLLWTQGEFIHDARMAYGIGIALLLAYLGGLLLSFIATYYTLRSLPPPLGHRVKLY